MVEPRPATSGPPPGPRDPGDAWVQTQAGDRYWGRFGAAGLLAVDPERGILLQHRVGWSHHGGTWGLPGGALHQGEDAITGALREAHEEADVPLDALIPQFTSVLDLSVWSYTTVVAQVETPFEPHITDPESEALEWVPIDQVDQRELHPGFATAWPQLRGALGVHPVVIVDVANLMGSVPNGWWKDRAGAASRWVSQVDELAGRGVPAQALDLPGTTWFPRVEVVVEGQARQIEAPSLAGIVRAPAVGDDQIVDTTAELSQSGHRVYVVTSDRGLRERVQQLGAIVHGAGWLRRLLD